MKHEAPRGGEGAPHWHAAREGRLEMPFCTRCSRAAWPPSTACRECGGELTWRACSGIARLVSWSVIRRAVDPALADQVPYVVAFVDLDEGVRLFTNIVDAAPDALREGLRLKCRFEPTHDAEAAVAVFTPFE